MQNYIFKIRVFMNSMFNSQLLSQKEQEALKLKPTEQFNMDKKKFIYLMGNQEKMNS